MPTRSSCSTPAPARGRSRAGATLAPGEAIAFQDSLWAAFRAGKARASWLIEAAKVMAANPDSNAAVDAGDWLLANYEKLVSGNGIFLTSRLPQVFAVQCSAASAQRLSEVLGPKVRAVNSGVLDFERTVEGIRHCGDLKSAKAGEIATAIAKAQ